jgi:hypothetical protein
MHIIISQISLVQSGRAVYRWIIFDAIFNCHFSVSSLILLIEYLKEMQENNDISAVFFLILFKARFPPYDWF